MRKLAILLAFSLLALSVSASANSSPPGLDERTTIEVNYEVNESTPSIPFVQVKGLEVNQVISSDAPAPADVSALADAHQVITAPARPEGRYRWRTADKLRSIHGRLDQPILHKPDKPLRE
jgi:hypothetical protein